MISSRKLVVKDVFIVSVGCKFDRNLQRWHAKEQVVTIYNRNLWCTWKLLFSGDPIVLQCFVHIWNDFPPLTLDCSYNIWTVAHIWKGHKPEILHLNLICAVKHQLWQGLLSLCKVRRTSAIFAQVKYGHSRNIWNTKTKNFAWGMSAQDTRDGREEMLKSQRTAMVCSPFTLPSLEDTTGYLRMYHIPQAIVP